jgi:methionyl-tRNA formyltransferase
MASLAPILTREDGRLVPERYTAQQAYDRWRGFSPWPGCWSIFRDKRFILHGLRVIDTVEDMVAGAMEVVGGDLCVGMAGGSALALLEVQMEGKPRLPGAVFARDFQLRTGERLD